MANNIGSGHVFHTLTEKGTSVSTSTVTHLTDEERGENRIEQAIKELDESIEVKIGNYIKEIVQGSKINEDSPYLNFLRDDEFNNDETIEFQERMNDDTIFKIPNSNKGNYNVLLGKELKDKYIGIRVLLPRGDSLNEAVINKQKQTADSNYLIRTENKNHILNMRVYKVKFEDRGTAKYGTNIIKESIYSSCNDYGNQYSLLDGRS